MKRYEYVNYNRMDEEKLKRAIYIIGPISVTINVDHSFFEYGGGLYDDNRCVSGTNHAVTVVGYGTNDQLRDYFIIR